MEPTHVGSIYTAKAIEYLIAVGYLMLFVPFWRYVQGSAPARALAHKKVRARQPSGTFEVPDAVMLHPGHGWVGTAAQGVARVGLDDFARRLVGQVSKLDLPAVGTHLFQGATGWTLESGGERLEMASPVDGVVVEVNPRVVEDPGLVSRDPYGEGWLMRVEVPEMERSTRQLLSGSPARHWIDGVFEQLRERLSPELGLVLQDGGHPVDGIAREACPEDWAGLARQFLASPAAGKAEEGK